MSSKDHKNLMKTLNKLVKQERWKKIPKAKRKVVEKSLTKSGNVKLVIKTKKEIVFYILKKNKNLFEEAAKVKLGDVIGIALRTQEPTIKANIGFNPVTISSSKERVLIVDGNIEAMA